MVVEKKEKITLKKPVTKKTTSPSKSTTKKVEIKEISDGQVKVIKQNNAKKTLDSQDRAYATGKRKDAVARVWIKKGNGKITINDQKPIDYLKRPILEVIINSPFVITGTQDKFNVVCTVSGGGLSGQAGAVKHGISKALCCFEPELRAPLKKAGFLTRDARTVERKKFGRAKARRSFQFSKR